MVRFPRKTSLVAMTFFENRLTFIVSTGFWNISCHSKPRLKEHREISCPSTSAAHYHRLNSTNRAQATPKAWIALSVIR